MIIENNEIAIRDFTETDLPLMLKWLTDDRVLDYYNSINSDSNFYRNINEYDNYGL